MINNNKLYVTRMSSFHQNSSTISVVYHLFELKTQHSIILHTYYQLFSFSITVDTIRKLWKIEEMNFSIETDKISLISVIVKNKRLFFYAIYTTFIIFMW